MKRKYSWIFNVVVICLCLCTIAFGVYSATTASITASGKIAFTAHGCKASATVAMRGHSLSADGAIVESDVSQGTATINSNEQTVSLNGGSAFYFSDLASADGVPNPIVITITVTNTSNFAVTATVGELTLPSTDVECAVAIVCAGGTVVNNTTTKTATMTATGSASGTQATFTFTLTMKANANGSYNPIAKPADNAANNLALPISFTR